MKAERRHELQENVLAHWLAQQIEAIKPYWQTIVAVVVVALVAFLAVNYFRGRATAQKSAGWDEYFHAAAKDDLEDLEKLNEEFPNARSSLVALLRAGDQRLVTGTNQLYSNPGGARLDLDQAIENYEAVLKRAEYPMIVRQAQFGLARALEGKFERSKAIEAYQKLVDEFPNSPQAGLAKDAITRLDQPSTKQWLAWFPKQDLTPKQLTPESPLDPGAAVPGLGTPGSGLPGANLPGAVTPGSAPAGATAPGSEKPGSELGGLTDPLGIGGVAAGESEEGSAPDKTMPEESPPPEDTPEATDAPPPEESGPPAEESSPPPEETATPPEDSAPPAVESSPPPEEAPASDDSPSKSDEPVPPADDPRPSAEEPAPPAEN